MNIEENIKREFEFIGFFQQYEKQGIRFNISTLNNGQITTIAQDGTAIVSEGSSIPVMGINLAINELFYNKRWEERKALFLKNDFIEDELKTLNSFDESLKKKYETLFYPLVKFYKEKLKEPLPLPIKSKEIPFDIIINSDPDIYLNWVLNTPERTRSEKKKKIIYLMGSKKKTIANYRIAIAIALNNEKYWKAPNKAEIECIPYWRKMQFEQEINFLNSKLLGNALPIHEIKKQEYDRISGEINEFYYSQLCEYTKKWVPKDFYKISNLVGLIDYLKFLANLTKETALPPTGDSQINATEPENNFVKSSIEDYLQSFKEDKSIKEIDYNKLVNILLAYFEGGKTTISTPKLFVKNGNKKRIAFALGEVFRGLKNEVLAFEYIKLGKDNLSLFKDEVLTKANYTKSNLYKYYTTKPH